MSRYPEFATPEGIERRLAEGRGKGTGQDYRPYFTRFDIPSIGERRETYSAKCQRGVHLLSRLEYHLFLLAEYDSSIVDIREQFPMPLCETVPLSERLGIRHPRNWRNRCCTVMTTDLLLTRLGKNGEYTFEGWSGKHTDSLRSWRTLEKQVLERAWHLEHGHRWFLRTELGTPKQLISNLEWIHPLKRPDAVLGFESNLPSKVDEVMRKLMRTPDLLWRQAKKCDEALKLGSNAVSLYICRFLIAQGVWKADLHHWNRESQPLKLL